MKDSSLPFDHILANRKAGMDLVHEQAQRGCPIAGGLFSLLARAEEHGHGADFVATTGWLYDDENDDDDIRPY